jgi:hypothetical protein
MGKIWQAREVAVKIDTAANITVTQATALNTFFSASTALEGSLKEVSCSGSEGDVEQIDLLGEDTNSFQNADKDKKPFGMVELTGKLVLRGDETIESFAFGTSLAVSSFTRYQPGIRQEVSVLVDNSDGTDRMSIVLDNADVTKMGDLALSADGHWERDFAVKCLARDYYEEYLD